MEARGLVGETGRIGGIWTSAEQPGVELGEEVRAGAAAEHNVGDEVGRRDRRQGRAGWRREQPVGHDGGKEVRAGGGRTSGERRRRRLETAREALGWRQK